MHSLRSGGISDPGCVDLPADILQSHGGWKLPQSAKKYIDPTKQTLLEVTNNLSI